MSTCHANLQTYLQRELVGQLVPPETEPSEQRRETRFAVRESATLYPTVAESRERFAVYVMDISANGMKVRGEKPLPLGQQVQVLLNELVAVGEVRYCVESGGRFNIGLK